jgi:hypothetical protein
VIWNMPFINVKPHHRYLKLAPETWWTPLSMFFLFMLRRQSTSFRELLSSS